MKNKKTKIGLLFASSLAFFAIGVSALVGISPKDAVEAKALTIPTTVDLKDNTESEIRAYYSYLENLPTSERRGQNLLKNLKYILVNNPNTPSKPAQYFTYAQVRSIYRITDRNWYSSPASGISGYNASTNKITGFNYSEDPYLYYYYRDDNFTNPHTATAKATSKTGSQETMLNQEHIWSKSHGFSQDSGVPNAGSDLHHLVAADVAINKWGHSEEPYGYVSADSSSWVTTRSNWDNGANAILNNKRGTALNASSQDTETTVFEPRDEDKGDFARAMLYMAARYNYIGESSFTASVQEPNLELVDYFNNDKQNCSSSVPKVTYGKLGDLLQFHKQDPVVTGSNKDFEVHRNNLIYNNYQYTRNPFIDFPEWVDYVWGDDTTKYAKPSTDTINGYNEGGGGDDPVAVTGVNVSPSTVSIETSATSQLTANVVPANATNKAVTWTSSNTSVATVSSYGLVTGIAEGTATITVTTSDGGYTASCVVTVSAQTGGTYTILGTDTFNPTLPTSSGTINKNDTLHADTTASIDIKEKAIYKSGSNLLFYVSDSNTPLIYNTEPINNIKSITTHYSSTCSVNAKVGVTFGSTVQSTYTTENNKTVAGKSSSDLWTCSQNNCGYFQISASNYNAQITQIDIVWETGGSTDSVSLNKTSTTLDVGDTETLTATASGSVTWSSLNDEIATVDSNGTITAIGEGTTTITATCGTATANCIVTVNTPTPTDYVTLDKSSMTIAVGNTGTLTANASGSVTWSSSDTSIATVDQTGEVTGIAEGTATITATCGTASATCIVTVSNSAPVISANGLYFRKITSTDELSDGKYIIAANVSDTCYAMSNSFPTTKGRISGTSVVCSNNKIDTSNASPYIVEIKASSTSFTISDGNDGYLAYSDSTSLIKETDATSEFALWTITEASALTGKGSFEISNSARYLRYSNSASTFGSYTASTSPYYNIDLYKEEQASKYAYDFMNAFTCDNGAHEPSFTIKEGTTKWSWALLKTYFTDDLDAEDKAALTGATANESGNTIEQAVARYDKVVSHWKYENFMSRSITGLNNRTSFISSDNELFIVIISTSSIVSVTAIGLYMLLKKRKEQ